MTIVILMAAFALLAAMVSWAGHKKQNPIARKMFRERVDGGIRLRETKNGLGFILPGGRFAIVLETWLGVVVRLFRTAVDGLRKSRLVNLPHVGRVFALDLPAVIEQLKEQQVSIHAEMTTLQDICDAEKRQPTEEETKRMEALYEAFNTVNADIERREKLLKMQSSLKAPMPKTTPHGTGNEPARELPRGEFRDGARISGGEPTAAMQGTGGFRAFGEFAKSVCLKAVGGSEDARLKPFFAAAPSTFGNEGTGADGGYLIPPDFRTAILKKVQAEDSLLGRTDQNTTSSNSIVMPIDETTPWQTSGGLQAFWEGESNPYPQSKSALKAMQVRAHKITVLAPITDEQMEDGPSLEAYLRNKVPDKINFKINDALLNGDGTGKPTGILNSAAKVTVNKEAGQATGTIQFANIVKMWSRIYDPCRRRGIWLVNQDVEPQLFQMVVPGTQAAFPAYMPPGGLSASPYGTLMGRPVVYTEACQALSTEGDIIFWDPTQYLTLLKASGMRSDVSIHLWFDQGLTAFRFTMRIGGLPWWAAPIVRKNGGNTLSCIVSLQTR